MTTIARQLRLFAHQHDDIPAFHAAYLVGTFLAAAIFNLGFFFVLILLHMSLDLVKYRDLHKYGWQMTGKAVLVENIVDIALFLLALNFSIYLNHTFALAALSGLVRSELTLTRALGTIIPKIEILEHSLTVLLNFKIYLYQPIPDLKKPILRIHSWALITIVASIVCLIMAAFLYHANEVDLWLAIKHELSLRL